MNKDFPINIFDRSVVRRHRNRAAGSFQKYDFLFREAEGRLVERLDCIKRKFPMALSIGAGGYGQEQRLSSHDRIGTLVQSDLSERMAGLAKGLSISADEEFLPFDEDCFDMVISNLCLHWVNDLPGTLIQIRRALKADGLFLATMLGGSTLNEMRQALAEAEMSEEGGLSPRISPFPDVRAAGDLLMRAGFALPVADMDTITVSYSDPLKLMLDLRGMGESNALNQRRKNFTPRKTMLAAASRYRQLFGDADGRVPATFQVITLTAWKPHPSQPKPLKPGTASLSMADALEGQF